MGILSDIGNLFKDKDVKDTKFTFDFYGEGENTCITVSHNSYSKTHNQYTNVNKQIELYRQLVTYLRTLPHYDEIQMMVNPDQIKGIESLLIKNGFKLPFKLLAVMISDDDRYGSPEGYNIGPLLMDDDENPDYEFYVYQKDNQFFIVGTRIMENPDKDNWWELYEEDLREIDKHFSGNECFITNKKVIPMLKNLIIKALKLNKSLSDYSKMDYQKVLKLLDDPSNYIILRRNY